MNKIEEASPLSKLKTLVTEEGIKRIKRNYGLGETDEGPRLEENATKSKKILHVCPML